MNQTLEQARLSSRMRLVLGLLLMIALWSHGCHKHDDIDTELAVDHRPSRPSQR